MRIDYLHLPELADKRHVVVDGRRTVNTAAKPSKPVTLASATSGATIVYTLDGSDPRYSDTAQTYSAAITNPAAGTKVRAVAYKFDTNVYASDLLEAVAT